MKTLHIILIGISIAIIGSAAFFLFFNGSNTNGDSDSNSFIGGWMASEAPHNESFSDILYYYWSFYENMTMNFVVRSENETANTTIMALLLDYSIHGNELTLSSQKLQNEMVYTYSFSADKQELVVTSTSNNQATLAFTKII